MDTEEYIASLRAKLLCIQEPATDHTELAVLRAALDAANHRIKCLEAEIKGLHGINQLLRGECGEGGQAPWDWPRFVLQGGPGHLEE